VLRLEAVGGGQQKDRVRIGDAVVLYQ